MRHTEISWYARENNSFKLDTIDNNKLLTYDIKTMSKVL